MWFAHAVHLHDADIRRFAATGTGTAHCPSSNGRLGAGIARVSDLLRAGAPVGLGVDGTASSELTSLAGEMRQALLFQRAVYGPTALTARQALEIGTLGGARCLGRQDEIGTLEPGKLADIAVWRVDGFARGGRRPGVRPGLRRRRRRWSTCSSAAVRSSSATSCARSPRTPRARAGRAARDRLLAPA